MKRLMQLLLVELIVVAGLAAALAALLLTAPGSETESYVFSAREVTDITSVQVENENGTVSVTTQDGGYLIDGVPSELVDTDAFIEFLTACSQVATQQRAAGGGADAAQYGLSEPRAQMTASYSDGETLTLYLGAQESVSGDYYFSIEGESGVYLLPEELAQWYLIPKESLISFYVTPELAVSSPLSALQDVTFSGGPLDAPVTIESVSAGDEEVQQLARSFGAATHIVRGAGVYELDQTYALEMLTPLCGMTGDSIVAYGLTEEQEDAMGFADPYMQVEFDYLNGAETAEHYILRFLPAMEDGSYFYVNAKGSGVVYIIARPAFLDISYEKLLLRWFLSPLLMDVSGITVESSAGRYDFAIDNTDARNPVVTLDGAAVDVELFRDFFQLLGSAANDGTYLGVQPAPSGEAVMTITYHYTDGKADDVMALYAGDSRRVNVYVNGVCEFAMRDVFVERVNQALPALAAGESFDINW